MTDVFRDDELMILCSMVYNVGPIWTARLCRELNNLDESLESIMYCGHCQDYANPRKRARAACLPPLLPGFETGGYLLHTPCAFRLKRLMRMLHQLEKASLICSHWGKIPDQRQPRGWDFGRIWEEL